MAKTAPPKAANPAVPIVKVKLPKLETSKAPGRRITNTRVGAVGSAEKSKVRAQIKQVLGKTGANGLALRILEAYALPAEQETEPVRPCDGKNLEPSACMQFLDERPISWKGFRSNTLFFFAFANPECYLIYNDNDLTGEDQRPFSYTFLGENQGVRGDPPSIASDFRVRCTPNRLTDIPFVYGVPSMSYTPHLNKWFAKSFSFEPNAKAFHAVEDFAPETTEYNHFEFTATNRTGATADITIEMYFNEQDANNELARSITAAAVPNNGSVTFGGANEFSPNLQGTGYYCFKIKSSVAGPIQLTNCHYDATGLVWRHIHAPQYDKHIGDVAAWRCNGRSFMYTNDASVNNCQGKVVALQVSPGQDWYDWTDIDKIAATKCYRDNIYEGVYGFRLPTGQEDLEFRTTTVNENYETVSIKNHLDEERAFLVFAIQITNDEGRDGLITDGYMLEFLTQSQWYEKHRNQGDPIMFTRLYPKIAKMTQFHKNEKHRADLFGKIRKTLRRTAGLIAPIASAVEDVAPMFGPYGQMVSGYAGKTKLAARRFRRV